MKVGVTGATGFIGKRLCQALLDRGNEVVALSRRDSIAISGVTHCKGDLSGDPETLIGFVEDLDVLYHCAGELKNESSMYGLHVVGTRSLLAAIHAYIQRSGRSVHWVQLSSVGAYGPGKNSANQARTVDEQCTPAPVGEYEVTKTLADESLLAVAAVEPKLSFTLVRPSNVVSAAMTNQSFFKFANAIRRRWFFYIGCGQALATYVHVDDVVDALLQCSVRPEARNETFILSNDCEQRELVQAIAHFYGVPPPFLRVPENLVRAAIKFLPASLRPLTQGQIDALVKRTHYSTSHAARILDFTPKSIAEQLASLLKTS